MQDPLSADGQSNRPPFPAGIRFCDLIDRLQSRKFSYIVIMLRPAAIRWSALLSAAVVTYVAAAPDSGNDPLRQRFAAWKDQLARDTAVLREQYLSLLQRTEKEFATGRQYRAAAAARREAETVAQSLGRSLSPSRPTANRPANAPDASFASGVTLTAAHAALSGGVMLESPVDGSSPVLTNWTSTGSGARWSLPEGLAPGGYEVELTFSGDAESGGTLTVAEGYHQLRRTIEPGKGWQEFRTEVIGTLRLLGHATAIELSAAAIRSSGLFRLQSLRLIPVPPNP